MVVFPHLCRTLQDPPEPAHLRGLLSLKTELTSLLLTSHMGAESNQLYQAGLNVPNLFRGW